MNNRVIQLSLFPTRGWALMAYGGFLHGDDGLPYVAPTKLKAERILDRNAIGEHAWYRLGVRPVPVEVHENEPGWNPTYIVKGTP